MSEKYAKFYPGKYYDWEKEEVDIRSRQAAGENIRARDLYEEALREAGVLGAPAEEDGPPEEGEGSPPAGGPPARPLSEVEIIAENKKWDPYNPLFTSPKYAKKAGLPGVPALPGQVSVSGGMGVAAFPFDIGSEFYYTNDGGDVYYTRRFFGGDVIKGGNGVVDFRDITVPDSDLRAFYMGGTVEGYDQNGKKVIWRVGNTRESYRKIIDGSPEPGISYSLEKYQEDFPPPHYTTDEEWEYIRSLWKGEAIRGANTLFWEDVNIGDIPTPTCSGPISYMDMGYWYSTSHFDRRLLMSEDFLKTQYRDRLGNYLPLTANHHGARNHPQGRMMWYNDTGMHDLVRMITNWISDAGFITRMGWTFKAFSPEMSDKKYVSDERFWRAGGEILDKVPHMKGRGCDRHGGEGDTIIGRGYVYDKFVDQQSGQHIIALATWAEDLEGHILQVCPINACLPSKKEVK